MPPLSRLKHAKLALQGMNDGRVVLLTSLMRTPHFSIISETTLTKSNLSLDPPNEVLVVLLGQLKIKRSLNRGVIALLFQDINLDCKHDWKRPRREVWKAQEGR